MKFNSKLLLLGLLYLLGLPCARAEGILPPAIGGSTSFTKSVVDLGAKCDGTTNDTSSIQSSANAAAGTYTLLIPFGVTCLVTGINLPSNSVVQLSGTLKLPNASNNNPGGLLNVPSGHSNIVIYGSGTIDGNSANQTSGAQGGVASAGSNSNIWISGITVQNMRNWPLNIVGATNVWVDSVYLINSVNAAEFANGTNNAWITNCVVSGITGDHGFAFYGGVFNSGISACRLIGNHGDGIVVLNDSGAPTVNHDLVINGNVVFNNQANCVGIRQNNAVGGTHSSIVVVGNNCSANNQSNTSNAGGIIVTNAIHVLVANNIIHSDGNGNNGAVGIKLDATANFCSAKDNHIYDEGQGGTNGTGISVGCPHADVQNNTCWDDQGTKTMAFCLNGTVGSINGVQNNFLGTTIGASNNLTYGADTTGLLAGVGTFEVLSNGANVFDFGISTAATDTLNVATTVNNATFKVTTLAASTAIDSVCYTTATGLFTEEPTGTTCTVSDERKKVGMKPISRDHSLDIILKSKPISFYYRKELFDPDYHLGFGAQTLAKVAPELVERDKEGVPNAVKQIELIPITWAAMQKMQNEIDDLKRRLK